METQMRPPMSNKMTNINYSTQNNPVSNPIQPLVEQPNFNNGKSESMPPCYSEAVRN